MIIQLIFEKQLVEQKTEAGKYFILLKLIPYMFT